MVGLRVLEQAELAGSNVCATAELCHYAGNYSIAYPVAGMVTPPVEGFIVKE